jgi:hypothetical protein
MRNALVHALMAWAIMVAVGTVIVSGSSPALATVPPAAVCPPTFSIVTAADGTASDPALSAVATLSGRDIWAVGTTGTFPFATLSEHFDGSSWSAVTTPDTSRLSNSLLDVAAVGPDDVWAVGSSSTSTDPDAREFTLAEHWDGSAWSIVHTPNPQPDFGAGNPVNNVLTGVAAFGPNDVWAVGESTDANSIGSRPLVEHWNGAKWTAVHVPHPGQFGRLNSISGVSAGDIWAVGDRESAGNQVTLIEHFNGATWSKVASPNVGPFVNTLTRVSATSATDVWAVGFHLAVFGANEVNQTSTLHWNGAKWRVVDSPSVNQQNNFLDGVVGASATDVWAVGFFDTGTAFQTLIEHWDGSAWTIVSSPNTEAPINELLDIGLTARGTLWTVGQSSGFANAALIEGAHDTCRS